MSAFFNKMGRRFDWILNAMAVVTGVILLFMMLLVCYDVIMRYLFRNPTGWAMEVCEYLLVYITFLGSPWLLLEKGHVNVDILFFFLPNLRNKVSLVTTLIVAGATFVLFIFCTIATWDYFQRGILEIKMLTIPKWTVFWVIPFGTFFICLEAVRQFFSFVSIWNTAPVLENQSFGVEKK